MEVAETNVDGKITQIGGSLPVENVQALAASKNLTEIPLRYIRSDVVADILGTDAGEIPIIDLGRLLDLASFEAEVTKLKLACEEWGFFQLINHGVPEEVIEKMKADIEEFFRLPLEDKKAYAQISGSIEGYGQAFVVSEEQELDWADMYFLGTQPVTLRNMRLWPTHPPTFRDTLDKYSAELKTVADCLLGFMAKNMGLSQEEFVNLFNNGLQSVRINYYPPCSHANKVLGLSPHSDSVGLTLLLQVNQVEGLQIKRNGGWLPIKPIPRAFIVNIGDILEILSNGRYKSIEHRAVINPENERLSIAAFHNPNYDTSIGPLPKLVEGNEYYRTLSQDSYMSQEPRPGKRKESTSMDTEEHCGRQAELGGSIKVDNVQALVSADPDSLNTEILKRYIRPEIEGDSLDDVESIPVIDMQRLLDPNLSDGEANKLKFACEEWGFFQLVNHDISNELIEKVKADVEDFFRLPLDVKEGFAQEPDNLEGYGQAFVVSEEQKLDWGDMLFLFTQPRNYRNMKLWPTHPPTFRETLDKYSLEVRRVAHNILGLMGMNLGLEYDKLINIFKEAQSARINYYPPCPLAEKVLGLSPHSDAVDLTLLLQVSEVQGLQIRRYGGWISVKPIPGAFVVNIGDMLEIYTNGKYKSIEHRAIVHPKKERISIAAFHTPKFGELIGPLPELVEGGMEFYRTLSLEDFLKLSFSGKLDGKRLLERLKLNS